MKPREKFDLITINLQKIITEDELNSRAYFLKN